MNIDLYPARLTTPAKTHERVRVLVVDDRLYAFTDPRTIVLTASVSGVEREGRAWNIQTTADETYEARKEGGCGCRDPLKRQTQRQLLAVAESNA